LRHELAVDFARAIEFNEGGHGVRLSMKRLVLIVLMLSQPAWAQMKPVAKDTGKRADNCAPIGRTEDGKLVYSMKCEMPPKPVAAVPPQAQPAPTPEPQATSEPETEHTGLFGMSYDRRPKQ
jgi:hypothetical protein